MTQQKVQLETVDGDAFRFDAWITGSFGGQANVTDHPIEDGSMISDHSQAEPRVITLDVRQTETPLIDPDDGLEEGERITEAMAFLDRIGRAGTRLTVTIPRIGVFRDMVLQAWPNDITNSRSASFEIALKQIEVAQTQIVTVPVEVITPPARAGQQEEADLGRQSLLDLDVDDDDGLFDSLLPDEDSKSALAQIFKR